VGYKIEHPSAVKSISISPCSNFILTGCWDNFIRILGIETGEMSDRVNLGKMVDIVKYAPCGTQILVVCGEIG